MKKLLIILIGVCFVALSFTASTKKPDGPSQKFLAYDYELGGPCNGHGGSVQEFLVSWNVATCKTNCEKKIGFRCGKVKLYQCRDGSFDVEVIPSSCPSSRERNMQAEVLFFDNNTIKLVFKNPMPESELGNKDFDVEEGEDNINDIPLPASMLLDGVHYSTLRVIPGIYPINYDDGEYGSVIVRAELIQ